MQLHIRVPIQVTSTLTNISLTSRIKLIYTLITFNSKSVKYNIDNICFPRHEQRVCLVKLFVLQSYLAEIGPGTLFFKYVRCAQENKVT